MYLLAPFNSQVLPRVVTGVGDFPDLPHQCPSSPKSCWLASYWGHWRGDSMVSGGHLEGNIMLWGMLGYGKTHESSPQQNFLNFWVFLTVSLIWGIISWKFCPIFFLLRTFFRVGPPLSFSSMGGGGILVLFGGIFQNFLWRGNPLLSATIKENSVFLEQIQK